MRTVAFDGQMGASGDMVLGALVDAGADPRVLDPIEDAIDVEFRIRQVTLHGIDATDVTVTPAGTNGDTDHDHDHDQDHDHGHVHHAEGHGPHRAYTEVIDIVRGMDLPAAVEAAATASFELLGEAEAAVHGTDLEAVHFHEVGADDAIADVVGAAALLHELGAEHVLAAPLATGGGEVETSHGVYPVPPPAVVEVADRSSLVLRGGPVDAELLTPTGAAILGSAGDGVETLPSMRLDAAGYGAGTMRFDRRPNVLRALVGRTEGRLDREEIQVLETNLDDATPELLGHLQERLPEAGALDVSVVPLTMKKSRPGHLVKVIVKPPDAERVARALARETGTLGVRAGAATHRWVADRAIRPVTIELAGDRFRVGVKVARDRDGGVLDRSAEYEDAAAVARETGYPVKAVMRMAETAAMDEAP